MRCFTILIHLQNPARVCVYRTSHFGRSHFECLGRLRLRAPALDPAAPCFPRRAHPMQDQAGWARRGHGAERGTPAGAGVSRSKDLAEKATFEPALEDKEGAGEGSARGVSSQQREGLGGTGKGGRNREGSAAHLARCSGSWRAALHTLLPCPVVGGMFTRIYPHICTHTSTYTHMYVHTHPYRTGPHYTWRTQSSSILLNSLLS